RAGDDITAKFTMTNFSDRSINIGRMKVEGRHSDGSQYDFSSTPDNLTLSPGQTYEYEATRSLPKTGSYTFILMNFRDAHRWSDSYPVNESSSINRNLTATALEAVTVTRGL